MSKGQKSLFLNLWTVHLVKSEFKVQRRLLDELAQLVVSRARHFSGFRVHPTYEQFESAVQEASLLKVEQYG
jgi:hypothetical protein